MIVVVAAAVEVAAGRVMLSGSRSSAPVVVYSVQTVSEPAGIPYVRAKLMHSQLLRHSAAQDSTVG